MKVKVFGAGSIGNHLSHASRSLGWDVVVCDVTPAALDRMKSDIYPSRYGAWDNQIQLFTNDKAPKGGFDLILIGTPPEYHIPLALEALKEKPRAILIEKPLGVPSLEGCEDLESAASTSDTRVFVGYTHVVGKSMKKVEELIKKGVVGQVQTLDCEFREHWEGIFKAHPWLKGPEDTYLGYWQKGGGASGEHSHAMNLWQSLALTLGLGKVVEVTANLTYIKEGKAWYDSLCLLNLKTEKGILGRVVQDVMTRPSRKMARIQGTQGAIEWFANYNPQGDAVLVYEGAQLKDTILIPKKRPDDFIDELSHVWKAVESKSASPLDLEHGLDTMTVLAAAHKSSGEPVPC